jgi:hypothetical protein
LGTRRRDPAQVIDLPDLAGGFGSDGVAVEVTRALGLDDYLILPKTAKIHLRDALREPVESITSSGTQHLLLDRRRIPVVRANG